jgi:hypothetical protein
MQHQVTGAHDKLRSEHHPSLTLSEGGEVRELGGHVVGDGEEGVVRLQLERLQVLLVRVCPPPHTRKTPSRHTHGKHHHVIGRAYGVDHRSHMYINGSRSCSSASARRHTHGKHRHATARRLECGSQGRMCLPTGVSLCRPSPESCLGGGQGPIIPNTRATSEAASSSPSRSELRFAQRPNSPYHKPPQKRCVSPSRSELRLGLTESSSKSPSSMMPSTSVTLIPSRSSSSSGPLSGC